MKPHLFSYCAAMFAALIASNVLLADEYDDLRDRWKTLITGGTLTPAQKSDTDIAGLLSSIATAVASNGTSRNPSGGTGYWDTLNTSPGRTYLWSDLTSTTDASQIPKAYNRLKAMALAYVTDGSGLEGNSTLLADTIAGLDWMYANRYNESQDGSGSNWFYWEIGAPVALNDCVVMLYSDLTSTQRGNYMTAVNKFAPNPTVAHGSTATGANRMWKCKVVALRGLIVKDSAKIGAARDALSPLFNYVTSGDGFYTDGSFIQHTAHPYTGAYGLNLVTDLTDYLYLYEGSTWEVTDPDVGHVTIWFYNSFEPFLHNGELLDCVRGRSASRHSATSHLRGRDLIGSFIRASQFVATADAAYFKGIVKHMMQQDATFTSPAVGFSIYDTLQAQAILADSGIAPRGGLWLHTTFASMDRVVHMTPDWTAALAMHSTRIYNFESINGENLKGWHTGAGVLYVYTSDLDQFSDNYWPTIYPKSLPGTTLEANSSTTQGSFSGAAFVGGVEG